MISPALTPILRASSETVTPSVIRTTRLEALGVVISVLRCSLPGIARRFLGTRRPRISRSAVKSGAPFLTTRFFLIVRAPGLAAASPGGGIAPWSGCAASAAGAKREGWPGRAGAPGRVTGADGRGAGLGSSILPSTRGPRWPSSSDGAAAWAEPVRLMVRPPICGRTSPMRRTPEPADGCIAGHHRPRAWRLRARRLDDGPRKRPLFVVWRGRAFGSDRFRPYGLDRIGADGLIRRDGLGDGRFRGLRLGPGRLCLGGCPVGSGVSARYLDVMLGGRLGMRRRGFMERCRSGRLIVEQRRNLRLGWLLALFEKRCGEPLIALALELEVERHVGLGGGLGKSGFGLGMPTAHHGGVEPLFDHLAGAGFDHGLAPQEFLAMGLLVKVALDAVGLLRCRADWNPNGRVRVADAHRWPVLRQRKCPIPGQRF